MDPDLIGKVAAAAVRVQENTDYCVFFEFAGHVDWVEVRIARSKIDYSTRLYSRTAKTDEGLHELLGVFDAIERWGRCET